MGSDVDGVTDTNRIRPKKSEVFRLWCDNKKINDLIGFKPRYTLKRDYKKRLSGLQIANI